VRRATRSRKIYSEKHIYMFLLTVCLIQTLFLGSLLGTLAILQIPDIRTVANYQPPQATILYDKNGRIVDRMFTENRTVVPLKLMSSDLPRAFVAAEDGRFFEHPGLDFFSVLRAAIRNFLDGARSQGGSTITQQVAKSLLLSPEKTYVRKFKEAILAWRIDKLLSKEEILYIYLNQIYLGEGAYGVEAASQIYFGKPASQVTLGESALLAGLPQAPSRYSLFDHLDRAVERQKYVLNRMAADGYITATEALNAFDEKIALNSRIQKANDENGYYLELVKKKVRAYLGMPLQQAGVRIYTYLDTDIQKAAMRSVRSGLMNSVAGGEKATGTRLKSPQGALVCIESKNSRVRAMVGGNSFSLSPFDRASQARRPAGSTFKPLLFTAALNLGWKMDSPIEDSPISIRGKNGQNWSPKNYGGKYHGTTTLSDALSSSLNAASVRLMQKIGYKEVHRVARRAGINAKLPADLSLALGATDVSLLEMTAAYVPFAGDGSVCKPLFIKKVVLADGSVIYPEKSLQKEALTTQEVLQQMRRMLYLVITKGTGSRVRDVPGVQGGKTGTSNNNRDAWFIGYDKKYTTGIWVGYDRNESLGIQGTGGTTAAPIWRDFMLKSR
jgi:penicillin-binding protein 1A